MLSMNLQHKWLVTSDYSIFCNYGIYGLKMYYLPYYMKLTRIALNRVNSWSVNFHDLNFMER